MFPVGSIAGVLIGGLPFGGGHPPLRTGDEDGRDTVLSSITEYTPILVVIAPGGLCGDIIFRVLVRPLHQLVGPWVWGLEGRGPDRRLLRLLEGHEVECGGGVQVRRIDGLL
jgi:hypothetical protein